jgi:hypothetical protein
MTTSTMDPVVLSHSEQNAKSFLERIDVWHEAFLFCQNEGQYISDLSSAAQTFLKEEMDWEADPDHDNTADAIREMVQEDALDVQVREGWHELGEDPERTQFRILITTGGPALRLVGVLEGYEPDSAGLEHQHWGTPWTEYFPAHGDDCTLVWYASQFYFGD